MAHLPHRSQLSDVARRELWKEQPATMADIERAERRIELELSRLRVEIADAFRGHVRVDHPRPDPARLTRPEDV